VGWTCNHNSWQSAFAHEIETAPCELFVGYLFHRGLIVAKTTSRRLVLLVQHSASARAKKEELSVKENSPAQSPVEAAALAQPVAAVTELKMEDTKAGTGAVAPYRQIR
jgi:hypothetical protein